MGMSTHVEAIGKPDAKFKKMLAVYRSCRTADIEPPNEVQEYFKWDEPRDEGFQMNAEQTEYCSEINEESRSGFCIELAKIPEGITHIRFWNSY